MEKKTKIIFATGNAGKMHEIRMILGDLDVEIQSMKEAEIFLDIDENGTTYEENALIKARAVAQEAKNRNMGNVIVLSDDSGIEVKALNNEPGIYSARYMGEDTSYAIKNANLIERLGDLRGEDRAARFVCCIAAVLPDGKELTTRGIIEGQIGLKEEGENGFGFDPIFYVPRFGKTTAQLTEEEKNEVSHRGLALKNMKEELKNRNIV